MRLLGLLITGVLLPLSVAVQAGSYHCAGGAKLSADQRRCSDGSIPMYEADVIQPDPPAAAARPTHREASKSRAHSGNPRYFVRGWALYVPGSAYQVPSGLTDYNRIVVSPGTGIVHRLDIRADRTFRWDQARGRWHPGRDGNVVLEKAYEGKDWTVTRNDRDGGIYVMDGFTWFQARE